MPITIFQFFHWYYPGGKLWKDVKEQAAHLKFIGATHVWLPPAYKAASGANGIGYDVYDLFDLGEFDQKGTIPTKYGSKDEYLAAIKALHDNDVCVMADIVLNHKDGADETEKVNVIQVETDDRTKYLGEPVEKDIHTKYYFPGRDKKYSDFVWDFHAFSGVDECADGDNKCIFKILNEYGKTWEKVVGDEMGNFDYLMGADIEFRNPNVRNELKYWGKWYVETAGIDSFRLDAVKHISPDFYKDWLDYMNDTFNKKFFSIAEYWNQDLEVLNQYLDEMGDRVQLFDVPLHYNFHRAATEGKNFNLTKIFEGTLVQTRPQQAITFVDNHDTQPGQSLESFIDYWFKPHAHALILLRPDGIPSVFHAGYYGAKYTINENGEEHEIELSPVKDLYKMMRIRNCMLQGDFIDYMDHPNVVAWAYKPVAEKPETGFVVVLSNNEDGFKEVNLGNEVGDTEFTDVTGSIKDKVKTNGDGLAFFPVKGRDISIWVRNEALPLLS